MSDDKSSGKTRNLVGYRETPINLANTNDYSKFSADYAYLLKDEPVAVALIINQLINSIARGSLVENLWESKVSVIRNLGEESYAAYTKVMDILRSFSEKHLTTIPSNISMPIENRDIPNERMRMETEDDEKLISRIFETFREEGYVGVLYDIIDLEQGNSPQSQVA